MAKSVRTTEGRTGANRRRSASRKAAETRRMGKLATSGDLVAASGTVVAQVADTGRGVARAALGQAKVWRNEVGAAVGRRPFMAVAGAVMAGMIAALLVRRH